MWKVVPATRTRRWFRSWRCFSESLLSWGICPGEGAAADAADRAWRVGNLRLAREVRDKA